MVNYKSKLLPEAIRTVNSASFVGTYLPFRNAAGAISPITNPSRMLIFVNNSGVNVFISWDGINDHIILLPGASFIFDETSNAVAGAELQTAAGTQFYAKGTVSTELVYLSTFYAY